MQIFNLHFAASSAQFEPTRLEAKWLRHKVKALLAYANYRLIYNRCPIFVWLARPHKRFEASTS